MDKVYTNIQIKNGDDQKPFNGLTYASHLISQIWISGLNVA